MPEHDDQAFGRYEFRQELGRGATGVVYLVWDPLIGRRVAVKTLDARLARDEQERRQCRLRFVREAQSAGILSHPNIVTVHDVVDPGEGGTPFLAMEYVEGTNLKEILQDGEPPDLHFVVELVSQVAAALDYAHGKGVVHRDIKPANIMITDEGRVKLTDFGIARLNTSRLTLEGEVLGTPSYMSPEQIVGGEMDHRSDIFALGVVLYELLTRRSPFDGDNLATVLHRIVHEAFVPPQHYRRDLPNGVGRLLRRALAKDPARRHQSAGELARDLRHVVYRHPGAPAASDRTATQSMGPRHPVVARLRAALRTRRPPSGRDASGWAWRRVRPLPVAVAAIAAALLLGSGLAVFRATLAAPAAASHGVPEEPAREIFLLLQEGRRLLEGGHNQAAAGVFAAAERLGRGGKATERLRAAAEARAEASSAQGEIAAARSALAQGQVEEALASVRLALASLGPHPELQEVIAEMEQTLRRRAAEAPRDPVPASRPARDEGPGWTELTLAFNSELPRGVLAVYAGSEQIWREDFAFTERRSPWRSSPAAGTLTASHRLPAGPTGFRVYVAAAGEPAQLVTLEEKLVAGGGQTLEIQVSPRGELAAALR